VARDLYIRPDAALLLSLDCLQRLIRRGVAGHLSGQSQK
jgi:hypothetical protein